VRHNVAGKAAKCTLPRLSGECPVKKCEYCGRVNEDTALNCFECGTAWEQEISASDSKASTTPRGILHFLTKLILITVVCTFVAVFAGVSIFLLLILTGSFELHAGDEPKWMFVNEMYGFGFLIMTIPTSVCAFFLSVLICSLQQRIRHRRHIVLLSAAMEGFGIYTIFLALTALLSLLRASPTLWTVPCLYYCSS
jgi:hypothetical protein